MGVVWVVELRWFLCRGGSGKGGKWNNNLGFVMVWGVNNRGGGGGRAGCGRAV